jgi:hypothetical protein
VVTPWDAPTQYNAWLASKGTTSTEQGLACQVLWPEVARLCFRVWEEDRRRWVTTADLSAWSTDTAVLRTLVTEAAAKRLGALQEMVPIVGMKDARYLRLRDGDGWAAAGVLLPQTLEALVGRPLRIAVPSEGVLVAWKGGNPAIDQVMAVGTREIFDAAEEPSVSPMAHGWEEGRFKPFGEAKPQSDEPEPAVPTP